VDPVAVDFVSALPVLPQAANVATSRAAHTSPTDPRTRARWKPIIFISSGWLISVG
jgi:hypothetical protein